MDSFTSNLKRLRTERLLTQKQVAEGSGISTRTLIRWEMGQGEPGASELRALASFFAVSIDQLVSDLLPVEPATGSIRVADLPRPLVDYWIAKLRGMPVEITPEGPVMYEAGIGQLAVPQYSADLSLIEPLMQAKGILFHSLRAGGIFDGETKTVDGWVARCSQEPLAYWGATVAEAGARAWLASEVGAVILA